MSEYPWRLLIVDGHSSHVHWKVVEYARNHRIHMLCLPPHATHLMQPLDVGCFSPLQQHYSNALQDWIYAKSGDTLRKPDFWEILCVARSKTFTKDTILGAWRGSGCWPVNPDEVIPPATSDPKPDLSILDTPSRQAVSRAALDKIAMAPYTHKTVMDHVLFLEEKLAKHMVIEPRAQAFKTLRSGKIATNTQPALSMKYIKGPRTLDRAYIEAAREAEAKAALEAEETQKQQKLKKKQQQEKKLKEAVEKVLRAQQRAQKAEERQKAAEEKKKATEEKKRLAVAEREKKAKQKQEEKERKAAERAANRGRGAVRTRGRGRGKAMVDVRGGSKQPREGVARGGSSANFEPQSSLSLPEPSNEATVIISSPSTTTMSSPRISGSSEDFEDTDDDIEIQRLARESEFYLYV